MDRVPAKKKLDPAFKADWIKALRSGEYQQGVGGLFCNGLYCCLGVGAQLCGQLRLMPPGPEGEIRGKAGHSFGIWAGPYDELDHYFPEGPESSSAINYLIRMNDSEIPFPAIADWIEKKL